VNQHIGKFIIIIGGLFLALLLVPEILFSRTGSFSAFMKYTGIALGLLCAVRPSLAPWVLTVLFFTQDYLKKVAVYYGIPSMHVLYEVMGVGYGVMLAAALGSLVVFMARRQLPQVPVTLYIVGAAICGVLFLALKASAGFVGAGYNAAAVGLPAVMAALICMYFAKDARMIVRLVDFQFLFATIWAVVALVQVYYGFSQIEWFYAETGLSPVASKHMINADMRGENPRPFGLGSGVMSFNAIGCYAIWGLWRGLSKPVAGVYGPPLLMRVLFVIAGMTIAYAVFESRLKTSLLMIPIGIVTYVIYRSRGLTAAAYGGAIAAFLLIAINAEQLVYKLPEWNQPVTRVLGSQYSILSFTARFRSLAMLSEPDTYTLTGMKVPVFTHDFVTMILVHAGVLGLGLLVLFGGTSLWALHRTQWRIEPRMRPLFTVLLTMLIPFTVLLAAGGTGGFHVTPNNFRIWTLIGCVLAMRGYLVARAPARVPAPNQRDEAVAVPARRQRELVVATARVGPASD